MKTSRGADPPYASKFTHTATRPDPPSKLQILFCKLSVALKTLFLVKKKSKCNFPGRKGEKFASADEVCEPQDLLEQIC